MKKVRCFVRTGDMMQALLVANMNVGIDLYELRLMMTSRSASDTSTSISLASSLDHNPMFVPGRSWRRAPLCAPLFRPCAPQGCSRAGSAAATQTCSAAAHDAQQINGCSTAAHDTQQTKDCSCAESAAAVQTCSTRCTETKGYGL